SGCCPGRPAARFSAAVAAPISWPASFRCCSSVVWARRNRIKPKDGRHAPRGASMKEFKDRVAVVTGAASGIGRALAERCCAEGMQVVLADWDVSALRRAERELREQGATVRAVPTDVSQLDDVEALARTTLDAFGAVHLLCNNAGVNAAGTTWESSQAD